MKQSSKLKVGVFVGIILSMGRVWASAARWLIGDPQMMRQLHEGVSDAEVDQLMKKHADFWNSVSHWGTILAIIGLVVLVYSVTRWLKMKRSSDPVLAESDSTAAWLGIASGIFFNLLTLCFMAPLCAVPRGKPIRPMALAALIFGVAGVALVIGLPITIISFLTEKKRKMSVIATVLSIMPLPLFTIMLQVLSAICGFILEE